MAVGTVLTDESPMLEGGAARVLFMYALRGNHRVGLYAVELINVIVEREILIVPPWVEKISTASSVNSRIDCYIGT